MEWAHDCFNVHKILKKVLEGCKNYENKKYLTNNLKDSTHGDNFITDKIKNLDLLCNLDAILNYFN